MSYAVTAMIGVYLFLETLVHEWFSEEKKIHITATLVIWPYLGRLICEIESADDWNELKLASSGSSSTFPKA
jgi:hypothetical protein